MERRTRVAIFGHSHTKVIMWAGFKQWSVKEVQTAFRALGLPEISVASIKTFLYSGRDGGDCKGRGQLITLTPDQERQWEVAAGRQDAKGNPIVNKNELNPIKQIDKLKDLIDKLRGAVKSAKLRRSS